MTDDTMSSVGRSAPTGFVRFLVARLGPNDGCRIGRERQHSDLGG